MSGIWDPNKNASNQGKGDVNWIRLTLIKYIDRFRTALLRDVLAMQALAPLTEGYIPWNAASMRPSSVMVILNEIMFNHRQSILECGSGISTIYIAALLRNTGGHLFTVENDPGWINTIRGILLRNRPGELRHHHRSAVDRNEPVLGRKPLVCRRNHSGRA